MGEENAFLKLKKFYEAIDTAESLIREKKHFKINCKEGCAFCCLDNIKVFSIEADNIRNHYRDFLRNELPHPKGRCAMLSPEGSCRIYHARPYVCRSHGLPLRTLLTKEMKNPDGRGKIKVTTEYRDLCELNDSAVVLEKLNPSEFLTTNSFEDFLAAMEIEYSNSINETPRIKLRDLFTHKS